MEEQHQHLVQLLREQYQVTEDYCNSVTALYNNSTTTVVNNDIGSNEEQEQEQEQHNNNNYHNNNLPYLYNPPAARHNNNNNDEWRLVETWDDCLGRVQDNYRELILAKEHLFGTKTKTTITATSAQKQQQKSQPNSTSTTTTMDGPVPAAAPTTTNGRDSTNAEEEDDTITTAVNPRNHHSEHHFSLGLLWEQHLQRTGRILCTIRDAGISFHPNGIPQTQRSSLDGRSNIHMPQVVIALTTLKASIATVQEALSLYKYQQSSATDATTTMSR